MLNGWQIVVTWAKIMMILVLPFLCIHTYINYENIDSEKHNKYKWEDDISILISISNKN